MTLFNGNPVDSEAYDKGAAARLDHYRTEEKPVNPYPVHSDQWHSWNKGWNSVEPEGDAITMIGERDTTYDGIKNITIRQDSELEAITPENIQY